MSRMENEFRLTGNLGSDPEVRYNPNNGNPIIRLPLAVNSYYKSKDTGEKVTRVDWFDLTVYANHLADVVTKYTHKGSKVQVKGILRKQVWESKDRKDAEGRPIKESRIEFVVTAIMLLDSRPTQDGSTPEQGDTYSIPEGGDAPYEGEIPF